MEEITFLWKDSIIRRAQPPSPAFHHLSIGIIIMTIFVLPINMHLSKLLNCLRSYSGIVKSPMSAGAKQLLSKKMR